MTFRLFSRVRSVVRRDVALFELQSYARQNAPEVLGSVGWDPFVR